MMYAIVAIEIWITYRTISVLSALGDNNRRIRNDRNIWLYSCCLTSNLWRALGWSWWLRQSALLEEVTAGCYIKIHRHTIKFLTSLPSTLSALWLALWLQVLTSCNRPGARKETALQVHLSSDPSLGHSGSICIRAHFWHILLWTWAVTLRLEWAKHRAATVMQRVTMVICNGT